MVPATNIASAQNSGKQGFHRCGSQFFLPFMQGISVCSLLAWTADLDSGLRNLDHCEDGARMAGIRGSPRAVFDRGCAGCQVCGGSTVIESRVCGRVNNT